MIIGFIGAGKMARALAAGLVRGGVAQPHELVACSRSPESGQAFLDVFHHEPYQGRGPRWTIDPNEVARAADLVVLAIKPQQFPDVLPKLGAAAAGKLFLSLAAGLTLEKIAGWLPSAARVVRAMPNTPMQVGLGASVYAGGPGISPEDYARVDRVLAAAGRAWRVEEAQIDAVTALSGSGPAYVFHFLDALARGGAALGLPETLAAELALQTLLGSATLAAASGQPPLELAAQVKSPGGTTLAGCAVLERDDALNRLMAQCLAAARQRAGELARGA